MFFALINHFDNSSTLLRSFVLSLQSPIQGIDIILRALSDVSQSLKVSRPYRHLNAYTHIRCSPCLLGAYNLLNTFAVICRRLVAFSYVNKVWRTCDNFPWMIWLGGSFITTAPIQRGAILHVLLEAWTSPHHTWGFVQTRDIEADAWQLSILIHIWYIDFQPLHVDPNGKTFLGEHRFVPEYASGYIYIFIQHILGKNGPKI